MSDHTDKAMVIRIVQDILNDSDKGTIDGYFPIYETYDDAGLFLEEYHKFAEEVIRRFLIEEHGDG